MPKLINTKTLREVLSVSKTTVWRLEREDDSFPKPIMVGSTKRYRLDDVQAWLTARQRAA